MLEPHEKILLEQTAELTQENNKVLHKLLRAQRWSQFGSLLRWVVIVGSILGAYYYLQPYLDNVIRAYQNVTSALPDINALLETNPFKPAATSSAATPVTPARPPID